ncbi:hypothetical protein PF011_g27855 [Phytophthora fragariae]|uniref:CCHC-type domain-containing protein n=1 Tax=Phytophthora fragariae TaxID=53985 RepID=A0A6A3HDI3_9STRA|nr:hypothetical protein PF011_g27855 [Phytophthora fragariae]
MEMYQGLAREHGDWINNHDRRSLKLAEAVQRLCAVEHQREQLRGQTGQSASQALKVSQVSAGQGQGQGASRKRSKQQRKRSKNVADKKQKTNCANCGGNGHWYSECTASTGIPLRPDLAEKDKARKQRQKKAPSSLVTYVIQTDSGAATRSQFAGLSLCGGQGTSDTDGQTSGTTPIYQDQPPSPTYSPTSTAESDNEDDHPATGNVPSTPQQLQLQPTVPDRQVQHVAAPTVQPPPASQWEGTRLLGPPPSWESLFYYVGQGLMENAQQRALQEPARTSFAPQGFSPYEIGKADASPRHATLDEEDRHRLCVDGVARRHATLDVEGHRHEEEDAVDHHHHSVADRRLEEVLDPRQGSSNSAATDRPRSNAMMVRHLDVDPRHAVTITVGGACRRVDVSNRHAALTIAGHAKSMQ